MKIPKHWPRPRLWVARFQLLIEKLIPIPSLASAIPFALPSTIAGIIIAHNTRVQLFTLGVIFGLIWLAIAPLLLTTAYYTVADFFESNRTKFILEDEPFRDLRYRLLQDSGSPKYLFLSIPLSLICVWVLLNTLYATSPLPVKIWSAITFGILFFLAGMGFWGISRFNYIFNNICQLKLRFEPYNGDSFGGLTFLAQFNVKGPQYFFSGALLFPIVFDVINNLPKNELISLCLWGVVVLFLAFGIAGFLIPQMKIKDIIARYKNACMTESEAFLQNLLNDLFQKTCEEKDLAELAQLKINVYYQYFHKRI